MFFFIDEYNPYCSKWGYCISYNLFGEEGPDQSKGAVQDGTRGQCRDDKDCTPWAPSCSPLGYCRYLLYISLTTVPATSKEIRRFCCRTQQALHSLIHHFALWRQNLVRLAYGFWR